MGSAEESGGTFLIDEAYEFLAPKFYDFINGESELDMKKAELWFDNKSSYAPSPCIQRIKEPRTVQIETLCDFADSDQLQKETDPSKVSIISNNKADAIEKTENEIKLCDGTRIDPSASHPKIELQTDVNTLSDPNVVSNEKVQSVEGISGTAVCTPVPITNANKGERQTTSRKQPNSKKVASLFRNPSGLKPKPQSQVSQAKSSKPASVRRSTNASNVSSSTKFAQENQAVKRQKLEGGNVRQILNVKPRNLPHKTRLGLVDGTSNASISTVKAAKEDRKLYIREPSRQFVSAAEMIKKFQSSTRDISLQGTSNSVQHDVGSLQKSKLKLTRPKEPEFETTQRARPTRMKSSAEMEEEMMAKMPKFKARPVNKKMLETPSLQAPTRSTPQLPEFKEFHLETMSRANLNLETSTVASTESAVQSRQCKPPLHFNTPKPPVLQTSLRARPPMVKSSEELEKEELEKVPKFKAKPLNKKIFESKGGLGIFCNLKRQITVPEEFHFALDERIPPPPTNVLDLFDKLSLNSEPHHSKDIPRITNPNPFNLHTEGRGVEKERRRAMEIQQKQMEEERARVPKATPYPYTTDFPVIPPKPEPKPCTKPEPFQLESLMRHEEEMQREMEERQRMEMEEAQRRIFRAQPILKEDPIPLPEKERLPLTQVQEFELQVEHRAVDRADFDKKIKEKEMMYKRYLEEAEAARMMEEEKALKQLRKTLVPHARPVPKFNQPFLPQRSTKEVTKAKAPKLHVLRRQERRKMFSPLASPASSAASNMR